MILTKNEFKLHRDYILNLLKENGIQYRIYRDDKDGHAYRLSHKCNGRNDACCFICIYQYGTNYGLDKDGKSRIQFWLNMCGDYEIWEIEEELDNPNAYKWLIELIQTALKYQRLLLDARSNYCERKS
jgi:hypothetical protein